MGGPRYQLDGGLNEPQRRSDPSDEQKYFRRDCCSTHARVTLRVSGQTLIHGGTQEKLVGVHPSFVMLDFAYLALHFNYFFKNKILILEDGGEVGNITD